MPLCIEPGNTGKMSLKNAASKKRETLNFVGVCIKVICQSFILASGHAIMNVGSLEITYTTS